MPEHKPNVGAGFFADFGADDMELYEALNEIIANSIDSWIEEGCGKRSARPELLIEITTNTNLISVEDNAGGMDEEQLKAGMGLRDSVKEIRPCHEQMMGMYGSGLKAAVASLGNHFEMISKKQDGKAYHYVFPLKKMRDENKFLTSIEEGYNPKSSSKETELKKILNLTKKKSGTGVYISDLKNPNYDPAGLSDYLGISWRFFIKGDHYKDSFGPPVKIVLNGSVVKDPPLGAGKNPQDYTRVDFAEVHEYKEKINGVTKTIPIKISGSVWLNYEGGTSDAGGITVYRRGQCIKIRSGYENKSKSIGGYVSDENARIEAFIECSELVVNQKKTNIDYSKKVNTEVAKFMKNFIPYNLTNSSRGFNQNFMNNVEKFNEWKLEKWWSHFETWGYKPPKELIDLVGGRRSTRSGGDDIPPGGGGDDIPPGGGDDEVVIFEPINNEKFLFKNQEYKVQVNLSPLDGTKIYDYYPDTGEHTINIMVDNNLNNVKDSFNKDIAKVVNKEVTSTYAELSLNFIIQSVIQAFLISQGLNRVEAQNCSNKWLINLYKE